MMPLVNEPVVRQELARCQHALAENHTWWNLQRVARCLNALDDPSASAHFLEAAHIHERTLKKPHALHLLTRGNLYRLAQHPSEAHQWIEQSILLSDHHLATYPKDGNERRSRAIMYYLRGYFPLVEQELAIMRFQDTTSNYLVEWLTHLTAYQRTKDPTGIPKVLTWIEHVIREQQLAVSSTGHVTEWDWYELAYRILYPEPARGGHVPDLS